MSRTHAKFAISVWRDRFASRRTGGGGNVFLLQHRRSGRKNGDGDPSRYRRTIRDRVGRRLRSHACDLNHQRDLHRPAAHGAPSEDVVVEIYRVFPNDSDVGRTSGSPTFSTSQVPTRVNSPSDVAFDSRDSSGSGADLHDQRVERHFHREQLGTAGRNSSAPRHRTPAATVPPRARRCSSP